MPFGLEDPAIAEAYAAVRSDKEPTSWLLLSSSPASPKNLALAKTGEGALSELAAELDPAQVQYAYARIEYRLDEESTRTKFVLIIWIGKRTPVMRKARVSIESGEVKKVLSHHSIQVDADEPGDLDEAEVVRRLKKAGGADYNGGRG